MRWFSMKQAAKADHLTSLRIAAPCNVSWESMQGDERVRLCGQCNKNVYNLSEMTEAEANEFLHLTAMKACVNFHKRSDGTIITDNCPVGLRKLRGHYRRVAAAVTTIVAQGLMLAGMAADSAKTGCKNQEPTALGGEPTAIGPTYSLGKEAPPGGALHVTPESIRGGLAVPFFSPAMKSYKEKAELTLIAAMPKNVALGNAAVTLYIDPNGGIKLVRMIAKSPSQEVDELILDSVRKLNFGKLPAENQAGPPVSIYFECRKAMAH